MLVDTHIHLQDYKTKEVKNLVKNAAENKVTQFINPSANPADWDKVTELARQYPQITPAYGIHPWYIVQAPENWAEKLENLLQNNPKAMVGECGIDRIKNKNTELQLQILLEQIELANCYKRALIIHSVKADNEFLPLLKTLPQRTIFHSFTGSAEWGQALQRYGFYLGLNFSVLRKKNAAEILKSLNLRQLLLETDGPYQSFEPDAETLPQDLPLLAHKIAAILQIEPLEFIKIITENQNKFFNM